MGLDMYLYKKHYVKNWDWMEKSELHNVSVKKGGKNVTNIRPQRISHVVELVGEWRKFNALHKWFVDNVQEGVDDCRETYVDESDLKMLLETLNYVLDNKGTADVILPIAKGYYFGDEEITEDYWNNIKFTIIWLKDLLEEDNKGASFYYRSSW